MFMTDLLQVKFLVKEILVEGRLSLFKQKLKNHEKAVCWLDNAPVLLVG